MVQAVFEMTTEGNAVSNIGGVVASRGLPMPLGASRSQAGVNFALRSPSAKRVKLQIFQGDAAQPTDCVDLDPSVHRTGHIWHIFISSLRNGFRYTYQVVDSQDRNWRHLLDPYAPGIAGRERWGGAGETPALRTGFVDARPFNWGDSRSPRTPWCETVMYELHTRCFTADGSSNVEQPGTYAGLQEKIPYLSDLGVTAVELLPIFEFEEDEGARIEPDTGEPLMNMWGYHPLSFMAPKASFSADGSAGGAAYELKSLVKAMHEAGIEVILDVVFNHTGEAEPGRPTVAWRGLDEPGYYMCDEETGRYLDFTGCGNTVNCNHPATADLILDSLRHWVSEYQIDGFRFDLASVMCRAPDGSVLDAAPLLERMVADGVLAHTKLIAEPWDASGFYQVGHFPGDGRFAEWNDRFRDDVRRFVRGDPGFAGALAARLSGSADLFHLPVSKPWQSVNFVSCHDGFTLRDVVSYSHKHNMRNGEQGRDGTDANWSWNCGAEGESDDPDVLALRDRQVRNMLALTLLASGTPMLLAGDELGRTQRGNNNAYCQDNELSWMDWSALESDDGLHRFVREVIKFRREHPALRRTRYVDSDDQPVVRWHGVQLDRPDWAHHSHTLTMEVQDRSEKLLVIANGFWEPLRFELPTPLGEGWRLFMDTAAASPADIASVGDAPVLEEEVSFEAQARSVVVLYSS
jgi:isoamylase